MRDMIVVLGAQARSGRDAARQLRAANYYGRVLPAWADIETLAAEDASGIVLTEPLAEGERYETLLSLGLPTLLLGMNCVLVLCVGSWRIIEGEMTLGSMMAFTVLTGAFLAPVNRIVMSGAKLQTLKNGAEKVEDILLCGAEERPADLTSDAVPRGGKLELRDVSFGYSRLEKPLIEHVSLVLNPGRRIAMVGASGSGKSTIAKLASGLYRPWTGSILLNDRKLEECPREEVVRSIASVDQNVMLFSGTVGENLTLFQKKSNSSSLYQALRDAETSAKKEV